MYPPGVEIRVVPGEAAARWEGAFRPGHFAGVLTSSPSCSTWSAGRRLLRAEGHPAGDADRGRWSATSTGRIDVVVVPTVREPDGLALSSRNVFLSPADGSRRSG